MGLILIRIRNLPQAGARSAKKFRIRNTAKWILELSICFQDLSDSELLKPHERVKIGQKIHVRITKIDCKKFQVSLLSVFLFVAHAPEALF